MVGELATDFGVDLLNLVGPVWVCAELFDLTGQLLEVIYEDRAASGRFATQ